MTRKLVSLGYSNIHIFLRSSSNTRRIHDILDKVTIHYGDLQDKESLVQALDFCPEIIYHLAVGGTKVGRDASSPADLVASNLLGTMNLLDICSENGFRYFINSGSSSEYGQKDHPMIESDVLVPNNLYGFTKCCSTLYCSFIGQTKKLPIYSYRIF